MLKQARVSQSEKQRNRDSCDCRVKYVLKEMEQDVHSGCSLSHKLADCCFQCCCCCCYCCCCVMCVCISVDLCPSGQGSRVRQIVGWGVVCSF